MIEDVLVMDLHVYTRLIARQSSARTLHEACAKGFCRRVLTVKEAPERGSWARAGARRRVAAAQQLWWQCLRRPSPSEAAPQAEVEWEPRPPPPSAEGRQARRDRSPATVGSLNVTVMRFAVV